MNLKSLMAAAVAVGALATAPFLAIAQQTSPLPDAAAPGDMVEPTLGPDFLAQAPLIEPEEVTVDPEFLKPSGLEDYTRRVEMKLEEAIAIASENNPDLQNARRDVRLAEIEITRAASNYDPYIRADASYSKSQKPSSQAAFGQTSETSSVTLTTGVNTVTGGSMSVDFRNTRQETDSVFSTLNPSYSTDLTLTLRQPILKNRYQNSRVLEMEQKSNDYQRALLSLRSKELEIESQVEEGYWNLFRSLLDLGLERQSLTLAERMHAMTLAQVRAGAAPQVSTLQTEANLASAQSGLIRAENDYRKTQASFKMTLNLVDPEIWNLEIVPTSMPKYLPPDFDREKLMVEGMSNNFALRQKRFSLSNSQISVQQTESRSRHQLDARASVGVSGLAGHSQINDQVLETGFVVPNPLPPDQFPQPYIVERVVIPGEPSDYEGGYMDAVENMFEGDNVSWSAGVTYQAPVGNRAAEADLERAYITHEKQIEELRYQEQQTFLNLITVIYDVEASHKNYMAARQAGQLQKKNLETEEKKFNLGLNTVYEVMQAEENYQEAVSAEMGALIEYNKAMARLERARLGYLQAGGFSSISSGVPISIPSMSASGGAPSGIDPSLIEQYSGMLPAGMDINSIMSMIP